MVSAIGLAIVIAFAVGTVVYLLDKRKGGQVIDLRPGAPKPFYRTKEVEYGLVVIFATDGKVTVEVKEPRGLFGQVVDALKGILTDLGKSGVEAAAKAATELVGDAATVKVEPVVAQRRSLS